MALGWAIAARRPAAPAHPPVRGAERADDPAHRDLRRRGRGGRLGRALAGRAGARRAARRQAVPTCTALALDGKTLKGASAVDAAEADVLVGRWLAEQVRAGRLAARQSRPAPHSRWTARRSKAPRLSTRPRRTSWSGAGWPSRCAPGGSPPGSPDLHRTRAGRQDAQRLLGRAGSPHAYQRAGYARVLNIGAVPVGMPGGTAL